MATKKDIPNPFLKPAQDCVCFQLRRSARLVSQIYDEALRPVDLRVGQFSLLIGVQVMAPVTLQNLAKQMGMDRTTLTRNLKPLERQGFLKIYPGQDRRERTVEMTGEGRRKLQKALPIWRKVQGEVQQQMNGVSLIDVLKEVSQRLQAK